MIKLSLSGTFCRQGRLSASEQCTEDAGRHAAASACLFTRTPSLDQAGGLQRMTLRGHGGGVAKVLLTAGGIDVITGGTLPHTIFIKFIATYQ